MSGMSRLDPVVAPALQYIAAGHIWHIIKLAIVRATVGCDPSAPLGPWAVRM